MLDVKVAVQLANQHLVNLLGADSISGVRLEEVELVNQGDFIDDTIPDELKEEDADMWDGSYWLITVSYLPNIPNPLLAEPTQRQYKVFKLKANDGKLIAMKMRQVA